LYEARNEYWSIFRKYLIYEIFPQNPCSVGREAGLYTKPSIEGVALEGSSKICPIAEYGRQRN
jgi:hypothetical protein